MNDARNSAVPLGGVPLLIGVTGHRDLDPQQLEVVEAAVAEIFLGLHTRYPHTPLAVLSPLLPGADQLVARVALRLNEERQADIQLVAVLPWPQDGSLKPDQHRESFESFEMLRSAAAQVVTLPLRAGLTHEDLERDPEARDQQRDEAGRYIARHSQILIALWDGVERPNSRTTKVIRWHQEGGPAPYVSQVGELDGIDATAVCHVQVHRGTTPAEHTSANAVPVPVRWIFPEYERHAAPPVVPRHLGDRLTKWMRHLLLSIHHLLEFRWWVTAKASVGQRTLEVRWSAINRFNRDVQQLHRDSTSQLERSLENLMSAQTAARLPESVRRMSAGYSWADVAAARFQQHTRRTVLVLFLMAFAAIAALEIYAHFWHEWPLLAAYLALLGTGWGLFRWMRFTEQQGRWLDYRALAEALRVQIFWRTAGLTDCAADYYLRHFRGELDWVRHAARSLFLMSGGHSADSPRSVADEIEILQHVEHDWLRDQYLFFSRQAPRNTELELSFETGTRLAFLGAVLITVFHLIYHMNVHHMSHLLVLATFLCLVVAAFIEEFAEFQTYAILSRKYGWMVQLFRTASGRLHELLQNATPSAADVARGRRILFEAGQEALSENAEWVVQHRQRPPMLPRG